MGFKLPTFNLLCNIGNAGSYGPYFPGTLPRIANQPCQLCYGRRVNTNNGGEFTIAYLPVYNMSLLLPALVDIRGSEQVGNIFDVVECPAGTGRWYLCLSVDDIGKGFANEHRTALIQAYLGTWVPPYA